MEGFGGVWWGGRVEGWWFKGMEVLRCEGGGGGWKGWRGGADGGGAGTWRGLRGVEGA